MNEADPIFNVFETQAAHTSIVEQVTSVIEPIYFAPTYPGRTTFTLEVCHVHICATLFVLSEYDNFRLPMSSGRIRESLSD